MKKILITALLLAGFTATAQVKVGSNPTTIDAATTNFQVEGTTTNQQFKILKDGSVITNQGAVSTNVSDYLNTVDYTSTTHWLSNPPIVPTLKMTSSDNLPLAPVFSESNALPFEYNVNEIKQAHVSTYVGVAEAAGSVLPWYWGQFNQIAVGADVTSGVREVVASMNRTASNPASTGAINALKGVEAQVFHYGSGALTNMRAGLFRSNVSKGAASSVFGSYSEAVVKNTGSATTMYANYNSLDFDNSAASATTLGTVYSRGVLRNGRATNIYGIQNTLAFISPSTGTAISNTFLTDNVLDYGTSLNTTSVYGNRTMINMTTAATGNVTSMFGSRIQMTNSSATSTITNAYGLYIDAMPTTTTVNNFGVYVNGGEKNYFSGRVGIGVNPSVKLQVETTDERFALFGTSAFQNQYFTIRNTSGIEFGMSTNPAFGATGAALLRGGSGKTIAFKANETTASNFPNTATADLFISLTGNVGINTLNPRAKLHVAGLPIYADNAAALAGLGGVGVAEGAFYHTGDGIVRVVY